MLDIAKDEERWIMLERLNELKRELEIKNAARNAKFHEYVLLRETEASEGFLKHVENEWKDIDATYGGLRKQFEDHLLYCEKRGWIN